jgi:hypothetical protein
MIVGVTEGIGTGEDVAVGGGSVGGGGVGNGRVGEEVAVGRGALVGTAVGTDRVVAVDSNVCVAVGASVSVVVADGWEVRVAGTAVASSITAVIAACV